MNSPTDRRHSKLAMELQCLLLGRGSRRLLNVYRNKTLMLGRSSEELMDIQRLRLTEILQHAAAHVPFYRERLRLAGFANASDVRADLLPYVPVLQREDLQLSHEDLRAQNWPAERVIENSSGGSTGTPVEHLAGPVLSGRTPGDRVDQRCDARLEIRRSSRNALGISERSRALSINEVALPHEGPPSETLRRVRDGTRHDGAVSSRTARLSAPRSYWIRKCTGALRRVSDRLGAKARLSIDLRYLFRGIAQRRSTARDPKLLPRSRIRPLWKPRSWLHRNRVPAPQRFASSSARSRGRSCRCAYRCAGRRAARSGARHFTEQFRNATHSLRNRRSRSDGARASAHAAFPVPC